MKERREALLEYIHDHAEVTISELCALFPDKSEMTIRRDLTWLEEQKKIVRVHGGAKALTRQPGASRSLEDFYAKRELTNPSQKKLLGEYAAKYVEERRSIFFDAGSTLMALVRSLPRRELFLVTSAVNIALELISRSDALSVIQIGGTLNQQTLCCSGPGAFEMLQRMNIDIAFLSCTGFSLECGFTVGDFQEMELKREIIHKSKKTIMLMDSSKINRDMPYTFARPEEIDILIVDSFCSEPIISELRRMGMSVDVVEVAEMPA